VVADDVRALATRTQASTAEISKLVEVMNQSTTRRLILWNALPQQQVGIHLVDMVTVALDDISENLAAIPAHTHEFVERFKV
jgi:methyl-accepting chemotaxis protein